jgi:hypothetical protein
MTNGFKLQKTSASADEILLIEVQDAQKQVAFVTGIHQISGQTFYLADRMLMEELPLESFGSLLEQCRNILEKWAKDVPTMSSPGTTRIDRPITEARRKSKAEVVGSKGETLLTIANGRIKASSAADDLLIGLNSLIMATQS